MTLASHTGQCPHMMSFGNNVEQESRSKCLLEIGCCPRPAVVTIPRGAHDMRVPACGHVFITSLVTGSGGGA